jgi:acyl dehydratase
VTTPRGTLAEGDHAEPRSIGPVTRHDFVKYAGASGDFNPNHTVESSAVAAGFPSVFAHGMFHAGLMACYATDWLGAANIRRFAVKFRSQVWPEDVLRLEAHVTRTYDQSPDRMVDIEISCVRQTGELAASGAATFVVSES